MSRHAPGCPAFRYPGVVNLCDCGAAKITPQDQPVPDGAAIRVLLEDMRRVVQEAKDNRTSLIWASAVERWANELAALLVTGERQP